ncbi:hypothetical protein AMTRI_Chr01g111070 [Amborella trichopoda]
MVEHNVINCSCKVFEFTGIICMHSLHVLFKKNFIQILDRYLRRYWRRSTSTSNVSMSTSSAYVERVQTMQDLMIVTTYKFIMEKFSRILEHIEKIECMRSPMVDETSNASLVIEEDENGLHCESDCIKNPVWSITKGRPREMRLKPPVEVAKKPR